MRNHNAKLRRETTMRNLDAKQKPFIPFDYYINVVRSREGYNGCIKSMNITLLWRWRKINHTYTYLSLRRSSGPRIERYGGTAAYELYYLSGKADARRAAEAFNKELGPRAYIRGHGCLKKQIKFVIANTRRAAKEFKKEHGVTYGDIRGYGYLKKLIAKGYGD